MKNTVSKMALILCSGLIFCQGASAQEGINATVTVKVTNATPDGKEIEGDDVTLQVYQQNQEVGVLESKVDADGKALFTNVPVMPGFVARASTKHSNMMFSSRVLELIPGQADFEMKIEVYETTTDNSKLEIGSHQYVMKKMTDKILLVTEYVELINPTGMAVTSTEQDEVGRKKVISFLLPKGFENLTMVSYFEPKAIVEDKDGFYDIMATPPGKQLAAFSYTLDISGDSLEIAKKISMPTKEFIVFSQLGAGNLQGVGTPAGNMTLSDGTPALYYVVSPCEKGREINLQLKGLSASKGMAAQGAVEDKDKVSPIAIILVILGVVVVIAILRALTRKP